MYARYPHATELDFKQLSRRLIGSEGIANDDFRPIEEEKFQSMFGVTPTVCSIAWNMIISMLNEDPADSEYDKLSPMHMLWTLYYLRCYPKERQISSVVGRVCRNNFRKWVCFLIPSIAGLDNEVVSSTK